MFSVFKFHQTHVIHTVNTENVPWAKEDGREQIKICKWSLIMFTMQSKHARHAVLYKVYHVK